MGPVINWNKCDGCGRCVVSCPAAVLGLRKLDRNDYNGLSFWGKMKYKRKSAVRAYVVHGEECTGCKLCQRHCHERALQVTG